MTAVAAGFPYYCRSMPSERTNSVRCFSESLAFLLASAGDSQIFCIYFLCLKNNVAQVIFATFIILHLTYGESRAGSAR